MEPGNVVCGLKLLGGLSVRPLAGEQLRMLRPDCGSWPSERVLACRGSSVGGVGGVDVAHGIGGGSVDGVDHWPQAHPEADLDELISLAVNKDQPVAIKQDGNLVGIVTKDALLRGIQGESE